MNDLQHYLELPYTVIMRRDEDGDYVARIDELPGCAAHGETPVQALEALEEAQELWITDCLESGDPVPEPEAEEALPSGKWVQRVPRSLHKKLVSLAKRENVSLNQLVASILAEAVGVRRDAHLNPYHHMDALYAQGCVIMSGSKTPFSLNNVGNSHKELQASARTFIEKAFTFFADQTKRLTEDIAQFNKKHENVQRKLEDDTRRIRGRII